MAQQQAKRPTLPEAITSGKRRLKTSCPICGAGVAYSERPTSFPFCSERCRLLDLGRWINERYAVPCSEVAIGEGGAESDR
jgi:endogenous inhibitor of DNA gyrase (YacG/DUF329 family)